MAAAIVPLIASVAPSLIDLITSLVHKGAPALEAQLGSGTGPVKFAELFGSVLGDLQKAATAGQIDKALPADETIKLIIQSVVTSMKRLGLLSSTPTDTAAAAPSSTLMLHPGQTLTIAWAAA